MEEAERKREELDETIRRVGDALATGVDRDGVVALAVQTGGGRLRCRGGARAAARPRGLLARARWARCPATSQKAIEAAERDVFVVRPDVGSELLGRARGRRPGGADAPRGVGARAGAARAVDRPAGRSSDGPEYLGAISIARHGARVHAARRRNCSSTWRGQAVVSIENASLHETVERQAVTDELTGLANVRAFTSVLDREIERRRRFDHPVGPRDDRPRRLQAGERHLRPPAGRRGAGARGLGAARRLARPRHSRPLRRGGAGRRAAPDGLLGGGCSWPSGCGARSRASTFRGWDRAARSRSPRASEWPRVPENAADRNELIAAADAALYAAKTGRKEPRRTGWA